MRQRATPIATKPRRPRCNHRWRLKLRGLEWDGDKPVHADHYTCARCQRTRVERREMRE